MNEDNNSIEETLTQDTEAEIDLDTDLSETDEDMVDWKAIALKNQKAYKDQKTRAEIAEGKARVARPEAKPTTQSNTLSVKDVLAFSKANVHEDDMDDVIEYANFKKIPVSEALKSTVVRNMIAEKDEFRKSQEASTPSTVRRATPKITDDTILENARKGKLDESDDAIKALFRARMGIK